MNGIYGLLARAGTLAGYSFRVQRGGVLFGSTTPGERCQGLNDNSQ